MKKSVLFGVLVIAGATFAAVRVKQNADENGDDYMASIKDTAADYFNKLDSAFSFVRVSNAKKVTPAIVDHPNVRAMLRVIRQGESSLDDATAYRMMCGKRGAAFSSFADHPRPALPKPCGRGASGAYQITIATWDWLRTLIPLRDFSPASQDFAAVALMAYRGALPAVVAGDLKTAFSKLRNEWTSLPGAAENGFTTFAGARQLFVAAGGSISGAFA